ncbi:hypothetical protein E2C01_054540 [Portunus trituberculatus]|uniref:Uncharacterized protein n=1 Tax=Portunus trituberculatus TaxID=210409 RepID=A0A5B7GVB0_PORTR|nr:hypothetical protein [Portunus trituberculatus]
MHDHYKLHCMSNTKDVHCTVWVRDGHAGVSEQVRRPVTKKTLLRAYLPPLVWREWRGSVPCPFLPPAPFRTLHGGVGQG